MKGTHIAIMMKACAVKVFFKIHPLKGLNGGSNLYGVPRLHRLFVSKLCEINTFIKQGNTCVRVFQISTQGIKVFNATWAYFLRFLAAGYENDIDF